MIYAIHNHTKEHQIADLAQPYGLDWRFQPADPDGWIEWHARPGAESPVANRNGCGLAVMRLANGEEVDAVGFWDDTPLPKYRVVAYRPILGAKVSHPGTMAGPDKYRAAGGECPAWDGEGLPTVGCECEWKHKRADDDQWVPCQIVGYHDEWVFVVDGSNSGTPVVKKVATWRFRPIRSEEDRAVEEMYEAATGDPLEGDEMDDADAVSVCRELYRAGYRKTGDN